MEPIVFAKQRHLNVDLKTKFCFVQWWWIFGKNVYKFEIHTELSFQLVFFLRNAQRSKWTLFDSSNVLRVNFCKWNVCNVYKQLNDWINATWINVQFARITLVRTEPSSLTADLTCVFIFPFSSHFNSTLGFFDAKSRLLFEIAHLFCFGGKLCE